MITDDKLNEKALEAAAQELWEGLTVIEGDFQENAANPDAVVAAVATHISAYLDALDAEGLADLYEYWCERVEALPKEEPQAGDTYAFRDGIGWSVYRAHMAHPYVGNARVLRHGPRPRQWKIGDLVDETRDLPRGAVVRDECGDIAEHDGYRGFLVGGTAGVFGLDHLDNPRIIWLPENGDES